MVWTLDFAIKDRKNKIGHVNVYLASATTVAQVNNFVEEFAEGLDAVINGAIVGATASLGVTLPAGLRTTPDDTSDREEGALFVYLTDGGYSTKQRIPTFLESKIVVGTKTVNQADTDVALVILQMVSGASGGGLPTDYRGADVIDLSSAVEDFKRYSTRNDVA